MTAAAQLVAEELECDWRRVRVDYADSNEQLRRKRVWGPMSSAGAAPSGSRRRSCEMPERQRARC